MSYEYRPIVGQNYRYEQDRDKPFKLSRSKIELFINCPRCFYREVKLGLRKPPSPGWAINSAVDALLKKEMDHCRTEDRPHVLFEDHGLNIKPFKHDDIEKWQNSFSGIQYLDEKHNFLFYGGVDDIMVDENGKLVVIDFKATAKKSEILSTSDVWNDGESYKRQLEIYSWLLQKNGFDVSSNGYLMYYNGDASKPYLGQEMYFRRTLVPFELETDWMNLAGETIHKVLQRDSIPEHISSEVNDIHCHECRYIDIVQKNKW